MSIEQLSASVISQIQSSVQITSLGDVVLGLFDNCLNAEATKVNISLDIERGSCTVEDDGCGITPGRLTENGLRLTATNSPANQQQTNRELSAEGRTFLPSVAALSMITITSKHHQHYSQNSLVIQHGNAVPAQRPHSHVVLLSKGRGTTVTVKDLFGRMPVRIRQRNLNADTRTTFEHEWACIRKRIIALLLARNTFISLTVREVGARSSILLRTTTNETASTRDRTVNLLCLAAQFPHDCRSTFVPAKASTSIVSVEGLISTAPTATKSSQFISINARPYDVNHGQHVLFDTVNRIFDSSDFALGSSDLPSDDAKQRRREGDRRSDAYESTRKHIKRDQKGVDHWPVFYLCVKTWNSGHHDDVPMQGIDRVVQCLVRDWLEKHHFRPRKLKQKTDRLKDDAISDLHDNRTSQSAIKQQNPQANTSVLERLSTPSADWSHIRSGKSTTHNTARPPKRPSPIFELAPMNAGHFGGMTNESVAESVDSTTMTILGSQAHESSVSPAQRDATNTFPWRNFTTGETVQIDSRTGMIKTGLGDIGPEEAIAGDVAVGQAGRPLLLRKRLANKSAKDLQSTPWMDGIMQDWSKSRFLTGHSDPIPAVQPPLDTCQSGCHHDRARKGRGADIENYTAIQLSKSDLREARVIAQVDRKYVLAILGRHDDSRPQQLVLIDQHAASERCILEELLDELCRLPTIEQSQQPPVKSNLGFISRVTTVKLTRNLSFRIPSSEHSQLAAAAPLLARWGILYDLYPSSPSEQRQTPLLVTVISLPPGIIGRCTAEPKLIERLMRDEARNLQETAKGNRSWSLHETQRPKPDVTPDWVQRIGTCPKGIIDLLSSRACRSAIMFNDPLTLRECEQLVGRLARCAFPFICAHGRVSMVPLVDMAHRLESPGRDATADGYPSAGGVSLIDALTRWKATRLGSDGQLLA